MAKINKRLMTGVVCCSMMLGTMAYAEETDFSIVVGEDLPDEIAVKEGPNGEVPTSASVLGLTEEEVETLKAGIIQQLFVGTKEEIPISRSIRNLLRKLWKKSG